MYPIIPAVDVPYPACGVEDLTPPDQSFEARPEPAHCLGAIQVCTERRQVAGIQHAYPEGFRVTGGARYGVVVVHRVHITTRPLVTDDVGESDRSERSGR